MQPYQTLHCCCSDPPAKRQSKSEIHPIDIAIVVAVAVFVYVCMYVTLPFVTNKLTTIDCLEPPMIYVTSTYVEH